VNFSMIRGVIQCANATLNATGYQWVTISDGKSRTRHGHRNTPFIRAAYTFVSRV